jgi:ferredoxin
LFIHKKLFTFASTKIPFTLTNLLFIMAYVISEDCIACGTCIDECPVDAISEGDIYVIDPDVCTDCGTCAEVCPTEAIHPE